MFWPRVCCSWVLLLHGLSTKTLSQPRGLISPAATVILRPCLWRTKSQRSSVKTTTCRRSRWRINVRHTACFNKIFFRDVHSLWWPLEWRIISPHAGHAIVVLLVQTTIKNKQTYNSPFNHVGKSEISYLFVSLYCLVVTFEGNCRQLWLITLEKQNVKW